jgi:hypothetical protein
MTRPREPQPKEAENKGLRERTHAAATFRSALSLPSVITSIWKRFCKIGATTKKFNGICLSHGKSKS